jgi:hypothetical protein
VDLNKLAHLLGQAAFAEMLQDGTRMAHETLEENGIKLSSSEFELVESGISVGIAASSRWFMKHDMLKDLEIKRD